MEWLKTIARNILAEEIAELKTNISSHENFIAIQQKAYEKELEVCRLQKNINSEADKWNNKWAKKRIEYVVDGVIKMDVRNLIVTKSTIMEPALNSLVGKPSDEIAIGCLKKVKARVKYYSDMNLHQTAEYWQYPEETWQTRTGDCEDGALLLASLMVMAGVPNYRVKVACGWVKVKGKKEGHAYVIYLADDGEWYTLDWCYWPTESVKNFKKLPHKDNVKYEDIWWTFNNEYGWSQTNVLL